jgi:hypothetical protein
MSAPRVFKRAVLQVLAWACVAVIMCMVALSVLLVEAFAPRAGEWSRPIRVGGAKLGLTLPVSVPALIRAATDRRIGPWLSGRRLQTPHGPVQLGWRTSTQSLHVLCAPCELQRPELSRTPVRFDAVELSVQRLSETELHGALFAGDVLVTWQAQLSASGLSVAATLPETPLASLFALVESAVPEVRKANIGGTASATAQLRLPEGAWSVMPSINGFTVSGLGTEWLLTGRPDLRCNPPQSKAGARSIWLERAVIAAEDQKFWQHPGYDLEEMLHALQANQSARGIERGGSTITQQLAKLVFAGDERTHVRKLAELLYAVEMEQTLGKARILKWYLAIAPWGDGVCGLRSAMHYLGKPAERITPIEAAWLAGMLRNPSAAAARLKGQGEIDLSRTRHVIGSLRPMPRAQREALSEELEHWRPPVLAQSSQ